MDEINQTGILWFKLLVYYGTEVSGASQSFTASEAIAEEETPSDDSGGGGGGITGNVIEEVVCNSPYIRHGAECCLDANNNSICDIDEGLPAEEKPEKETEKEETPLLGTDFLDIKINKTYLLIGTGALIFIFLLIFTIIKIFKYRNRSEKVNYLDAKLKHLKELKSRKEISKSSYATERGRLLSRINTILKGKHLVLILGAVGLISLFMLIPKPTMTGGAIGVGESNLGAISWWAVFAVLVVLFLAGIFAVLIYILKEIRKLRPGWSGNNMGRLENNPNNDTENVIKIPSEEKHDTQKSYSTTSLNKLINKKVYTNSGHYVGKIKDIVLEENRIDSLKIKLDRKQRFRAKGIIINYKHVKSVGHVVIVDEEIIKQLESS